MIKPRWNRGSERDRLVPRLHRLDACQVFAKPLRAGAMHLVAARPAAVSKTGRVSPIFF
jgi:hypothetical protein